MASIPVQVTLSPDSAEFLRHCTESGEFSGVSEAVEQFVQEESARRCALEETLLAALASGRIEVTIEELQREDLMEILESRTVLPADDPEW